LGVINEIRDKKENGNHKGPTHAGSMRLDVALANEIETEEK